MRHERFDTPGKLRLDLSVPAGEIDVRPELGAQTGSGDIAIGRAGGRATLRSASGDVAVQDAATDLTVQTASGDVGVKAVSAGEVSVQSASGDVSVGVRKGRTVWMDAKSM